MRKIFLLALVLGLAQTVHAAIDWQGSARPALWRSSITAANMNFVVLATGTIHVHSIVITSPTINQESMVSVFAGTSTAVGGYNVNTATAVMVNTNSTTVSPLSPNEEVLFDVDIPSGAVINKPTFGSIIHIKWDYQTPRGLQNSWVPYWP